MLWAGRPLRTRFHPPHKTGQQDPAIPRGKAAWGVRVAGRAAARSPGARSGAAASPAAAGGTRRGRGRAGVAGLLGSRSTASELGLLWSVRNDFLRWRPGTAGLRVTHFARHGVEFSEARGSRRRPPASAPPRASSQRRRAGGLGQTKGAKAAAAAERSAAWPAGGAVRARAYL